MNILRDYLEEISRVKKEISAGNISKKGIEKLHKAGNIKPYEEYLHGPKERPKTKQAEGTIKGVDGAKVTRKPHTYGFEPGTHKIIEKHGGKVQHDQTNENPGNIFQPTIPSANVMGPHFRPDTKTIHLPRTDKHTAWSILARHVGKEKMKKEEPILKRHEAYELAASAKHPKARATVTKFGILPKGAHNSLDVLKNEKKDTDYENRAYGKENNSDWIRGFRKKSHEYDLVDKTSNQQRRRLNKKNHNFDTTTKGDIAGAAAKVAGVVGAGYAAKKLYDRHKKRNTFVGKLKRKFKKIMR